MNIGVIDGSSYLKGLLLLVRKDHRITDSEIRLMRHVGATLGFEFGFCENAIREILRNKYIADVPPEFSTKELTEKFVKDGLALAASDDEVHPREDEWLRQTAEKNGLGSTWYRQERAAAVKRRHSRLEVDSLTVGHF